MSETVATILIEAKYVPEGFMVNGNYTVCRTGTLDLYTKGGTPVHGKRLGSLHLYRSDDIQLIDEDEKLTITFKNFEDAHDFLKKVSCIR